ncbi:MAG: dihydropteroate synthase [Povalibacter sp.]
MFLQCGPHRLDLASPVVMGVLNVTPDSFSDGGSYASVDRAISHGLSMLQAGAAIIDVGGESTRPGAEDVSEEQEIQRVVPVVKALVSESRAVISVDTSKPGVIRAAVQAGATLINDVRALREPDALEAVAESNAGVCLMHMLGEPRTMQANPVYVDVVAEVREFLKERVRICEANGIAVERIAIDPGIGFGKRVEHNLQLFSAIPELTRLQRPVLIGVSRKSMFATMLGKKVDERLSGSIAMATAAALAGASILRVHDVAETIDAIKIVTALKQTNYRIL